MKPKTNELANLRHSPKYAALNDEEFRFITKFNLSAFFNPFVWALGNKLYIWALFTLIPLFGIYAWLKLVIDGRRMAWEEGWTSVAQFKKRQFVMAFVVLITTVLLVGAQFFMQNQDAGFELRAMQSEQISYCTDSDEDGLSNQDEIRVFRTNPFLADTDGDGFMDGDEVKNGYSPNGPSTLPEGIVLNFQQIADKSCS